MKERCPVCSKLSVSVLQSTEYGKRCPPYYKCQSCNWMCEPGTIRRLERYTHSINAGMAHLFDLLTPKLEDVTTCGICGYTATWNEFFKAAKASCHLFCCPYCPVVSIIGSPENLHSYRLLKDFIRVQSETYYYE